VFGATMVLMMLFRPEGIVTNIRRVYQFRNNRKDGIPA
jgi:ABC-type branched-subunit amino acid transport system permease subunit